jgi:hypothetical protein
MEGGLLFVRNSLHEPGEIVCEFTAPTLKQFTSNFGVE